MLARRQQIPYTEDAFRRRVIAKVLDRVSPSHIEHRTCGNNRAETHMLPKLQSRIAVSNAPLWLRNATLPVCAMSCANVAFNPIAESSSPGNSAPEGASDLCEAIPGFAARAPRPVRPFRGIPRKSRSQRQLQRRCTGKSIRHCFCGSRNYSEINFSGIAAIFG